MLIPVIDLPREEIIPPSVPLVGQSKILTQAVMVPPVVLHAVG